MKKLNIKPLGDRIVVEPDLAEKVSTGGIIIPETAQERPARGTVVAVSENKPDLIHDVKLGDKVLYSKYAGTEVELEGASYLIMREADVLMVEL